MATTKRIRSHSMVDSSPPSLPASPTPKASRSLHSSGTTGHPLLCTLPPTCHSHPTKLANSKDLEHHYATHHAHVCEEQGCGCVFPDARLLELHQTECHDPLAAIRKDRGDKIFACHLSSCPKVFSTPKSRRLHLIAAHGYPKEYFFAVTNKGIGGLLRKWGEGASMIRGEWKKREEKPDTNKKEKNAIGRTTGGYREETMDIDKPESISDDTPEGTEEEISDLQLGEDQSDHDADYHQYRRTARDGVSTDPHMDALMNKLTQDMDSLNLIPSSIRFGRGGKQAGFGRPQANTASQAHEYYSDSGVRGRGANRGLNTPTQRGMKTLANSKSFDTNPTGVGGDNTFRNQQSPQAGIIHIPGRGGHVPTHSDHYGRGSPGRGYTATRGVPRGGRRARGRGRGQLFT